MGFIVLIMNKDAFVALMVWAIDVDALNISVEKCWEMFQRDAWGMYKTYTDPNSELFCKNLVGENPIDVFIDYILFYAKMHVQSGIISYGVYDNTILNYGKEKTKV
jgi:hypothetical protein